MKGDVPDSVLSVSSASTVLFHHCRCQHFPRPESGPPPGPRAYAGGSCGCPFPPQIALAELVHLHVLRVGPLEVHHDLVAVVGKVLFLFVVRVPGQVAQLANEAVLGIAGAADHGVTQAASFGMACALGRARSRFGSGRRRCPVASSCAKVSS